MDAVGKEDRWLGIENAEEPSVGKTIPSGSQALGSMHSNLDAEA